MNTTTKPVALNNETFPEIVEGASGVALVDFWAPWCPPCLALAPTIDALAERFDGRARVAKLNVDENQPLASRFNVSSIPTLILFRDGVEVDRVVGLASEEELASRLEALL